MALTDDEQKKLEAELAQARADLTAAQDAVKAEELRVAKEKEADRAKSAKGGGADPAKEKPTQPQIDPDVVKEVAELKAKVAALEGVKKDAKKPGFEMPDFFKALRG